MRTRFSHLYFDQHVHKCEETYYSTRPKSTSTHKRLFGTIHISPLTGSPDVGFVARDWSFTASGEIILCSALPVFDDINFDKADEETRPSSEHEIHVRSIICLYLRGPSESCYKLSLCRGTDLHHEHLSSQKCIHPRIKRRHRTLLGLRRLHQLLAQWSTCNTALQTLSRNKSTFLRMASQPVTGGTSAGSTSRNSTMR